MVREGVGVDQREAVVEQTNLIRIAQAGVRVDREEPAGLQDRSGWDVRRIGVAAVAQLVAADVDRGTTGVRDFDPVGAAADGLGLDLVDPDVRGCGGRRDREPCGDAEGGHRPGGEGLLQLSLPFLPGSTGARGTLL